MSTITSLLSTDGITAANSMVKINTNFSNLNADKEEITNKDTDVTLAANSDTKYPSQKAVKAYIDSKSTLAQSTTTTTVTPTSLTTIANQRVLVIVKGSLTIAATATTATVTLAYNSVTKDSVSIRQQGGTSEITPFTLIYTETPGAATQNITVTPSAGSIADLVIMVEKFNV